MATEVTGTIGEDKALVIKDSEGKEVRYTLESDLLTVKGSRDDLQGKVDTADKDKVTAVAEATTKAEDANQAKLKAEARVSSLEEQIAKGGGTAEELAEARKQLETAKTSGEELGTKFLDLRRTVIVATYGVPKETVDSKDLAALEVYEEALKAVVGQKKLGNLAVGGAGGGANALEGKSPMELAQLAYAEPKK